jgi:hypothetical protein
MASIGRLGWVWIVGAVVAGAIAVSEERDPGEVDAGSSAVGPSVVVGTGRPVGQPDGGEPPAEEAGDSEESGSGAATSVEPRSEEEAAQAAVEEYLTALVDGDSATACALLSPEASRQGADLAQSEPGLARDCETVIDRGALARLPSAHAFESPQGKEERG